MPCSGTIPDVPVPEVVDDLGEVEVAGEGPGHVLAHARRSLESEIVFADFSLSFLRIFLVDNYFKFREVLYKHFSYIYLLVDLCIDFSWKTFG